MAKNNVTLFGIKNCDTVKKSQKWLTENNIAFEFHDFKVQGLSETLLKEFLRLTQWEALLNKRSTTYRQLDEETKLHLNAESAYTAMLAQPTLIKRPVVIIDNTALHVGFNATKYQEIFA